MLDGIDRMNLILTIVCLLAVLGILAYVFYRCWIGA